MKKGEIWKVQDARRGAFTCKLLEDVPEGGGDVDVEIVDGEAAAAGDAIRVRTSQMEFLERLK